MSIYFVQAGKDGPIKIGVSDDPKKRLSNLQVGHHKELVLLQQLDGGEDKERWLHSVFARLRLNSEWFSPGSMLLAGIENPTLLDAWWIAEQENDRLSGLLAGTSTKRVDKMQRAITKLRRQKRTGLEKRRGLLEKVQSLKRELRTKENTARAWLRCPACGEIANLPWVCL